MVRMMMMIKDTFMSLWQLWANLTKMILASRDDLISYLDVLTLEQGSWRGCEITEMFKINSAGLMKPFWSCVVIHGQEPEHPEVVGPAWGEGWTK